MMKWEFEVGDIVQHDDESRLIGVIVRQVFSQDVDEDMEVDQPWYVIIWTNTPDDEETYAGQESEGQLRLVRHFDIYNL